MLRHNKLQQIFPVTNKVESSKRNQLIRELIKKGLGSGSIAVRLNNQGIQCSRADVEEIRTGRRPQYPGPSLGEDVVLHNFQ